MVLNLCCGDSVSPDHISCDLRITNSMKQGNSVQCDARQLPFRSRSFHRVIINHALEHFYLRDVYIVLSEINRVLKYRGILYVNVPNIEASVDWIRENPNDLDIERFSVRVFGAHEETEYKGQRHRMGFNLEILNYIVTQRGFRVFNIIGERPEIVVEYWKAS